MQQRLTNNAGIGLAIAVWLAHDDYDYVDKPNYLSATTLNKPIRQIVLTPRVPVEQRNTDLEELIQSRFGQTLHFGVEVAWKTNYAQSMQRLGYPPGLIRRVRVNPSDEEVAADPDIIAVYTEIRTERQLGKWTIGGKLDLTIEGRLHDIKKTSVWGYQKLKGISDEKWIEQLSTYRWLNPTKIVHDEAHIQYILLDWQRSMKRRDPNYPPHAVPERQVKLLSEQETEQRLREKLRAIEHYWDAPETEIPHCSDEDLWRSDPQYKYFAGYSNVADIPAGKRSTKNFDDLATAMQHKANEGKGVVLVVPGLAKACAYCAAFQVCSQKDYLMETGQLDLGQ